jgi:enoyl-CoA hydratase
MNDQHPATPDVLFRDEGRCGFITLNRPQALNALNHNMITAMEAQYVKWAVVPRIYGVVVEAVGPAFCSGGDLRALNWDTPDATMTYFRDEYQLNWSLETFTKPNVALIDGLVMGGGVGISLYGTHRVAGENFCFAMPEVSIGFFPDIGGGYFLSRLPGEMGLYLGLTGRRIGRSDAYYLGIASHCVAASDFDKIRHAVIEGDPIDPVLDDLHRDPGESELEHLQELVDRIFSEPTIEAILARLDEQSGVQAAWAKETAAIIRSNAPLSVKVTLKQIRDARGHASLKDTLTVDYRLARAFIEAPDFREGIRAVVIDKDRAPKWRPHSLNVVTESMNNACFVGGDDLELKDRWTLVV